MKQMLIIVVSLTIFAALLTGCGKKKKVEHGGVIFQSGEYSFETVFSNLGVEIYPTKKSGPVLLSGVVGSATVFVEGEDPRWADLQERDDALFVPFVFPTVGGYQAKVEFNIQKLDGKAEEVIKYTAPVELNKLYGWTCPNHPAITTLRPGKCVKCDKADKVPAEVIFQCPKHTDVVSLHYGKCDLCEGISLAIRPVVDR